MKSYAVLSSDGYVVSTCHTDKPQPDMVELSQTINDAPTPWHKYHLATDQWVEDKPLEVCAFEAKQQRQRLLTESDWTQLPDVPVNTKYAWVTYRQALRDITEQSGYPTEIIWPTPPQ
jgi:hypothetical protein